MPTLKSDGYEIHRNIFSSEEAKDLRLEAAQISKSSGTTCVRGITEKSDVFKALAKDPRLTKLLTKELKPVRSILFDKTPHENWPVAWHQDLTITVKEKHDLKNYEPWSQKDGIPHVQPPLSLLQNMATIRIHLDETNKGNGALHIIPKSYLLGKIPSSCIQEQINDTEVICECSPGDVLIMSPLILHASRRSTKPSHRRIIHFEYAQLSDLHPELSWS